MPGNVELYSLNRIENRKSLPFKCAIGFKAIYLCKPIFFYNQKCLYTLTSNINSHIHNNKKITTTSYPSMQDRLI